MLSHPHTAHQIDPNTIRLCHTGGIWSTTRWPKQRNVPGWTTMLALRMKTWSNCLKMSKWEGTGLSYWLSMTNSCFLRLPSLCYVVCDQANIITCITYPLSTNQPRLPSHQYDCVMCKNASSKNHCNQQSHFVHICHT